MNSKRPLYKNLFLNHSLRKLNDSYSLSRPKIASRLKKKGIKVREFRGVEFRAG